MPAQDTDDEREADGYRPDETQAERDDRNLADLLQELRVAGLGIQVIFGFMLGLPFTSKFSELGPGQRTLYIVTLLLAAVATALLVGPVAYHRLVFRRHLKRHLVRAANVMAILGLAAVALTVSAAVLLVVSYVAHGAPAVIIGVFVVCVFAGLWFVYPLTRHWDSQPEPPGPPEPPPGPSHDRRAGSGRH
jgi:MFS family permease